MLLEFYSLFIQYGATERKYKKNEIIFSENEQALAFYIIVKGNIRMFNRNEDGREFVQGYFSCGQSFGEPPLFCNERYPTTASCVKDSLILKLPKANFVKLLEENTSLQFLFLQVLAKRIVNKAKSSNDIINQNTKQKLISFFQAQKNNRYHNNPATRELIPFTRQEIANFTGLRVETVIRVCSKLKKESIIDIIDHKIYF